MNELPRHIEILLVTHDCVTVPGLGGFVAHYEESHISENIFYPPLRTLGFNAQLQHNDYLLAQSYQDAYDISYPEAFRRIEREVEEIRQTMRVNGYYQFNGIGTLTFDTEEHLTFTPASAGLQTPSLFGLGMFTLDELEELSSSNHSNIVPLMPTLRKVAAAILVMIIFTLSVLPAGIGSDNTAVSKGMMQSSIVNMSALANIINKDTRTHTTNVTAVAESKKEDVVQTSKDYTIVLACKVGRSGANDMISAMEREGLSGATILESNPKNRKVIYGSYATEDEAAQNLRTLREENGYFSQAWVMRINN